ncbi:MAG TPA: hypothetical protein PKC63_05970 [Mariniflexile sp.]|nr:hypothetical protein [Mariniflexile sp.]
MEAVKQHYLFGFFVLENDMGLSFDAANAENDLLINNKPTQ